MPEASKVLTKVEWSIRPITRYVVTRYEEGHDATVEQGKPNWSGSTQHGVFDNEEVAYEVSYALAERERVQLGWDLGDERLKYPRNDPRYPDAA